MASEESDQLRPGFLAVHGLSDLRDPQQPISRQVLIRGDHREALRKLLEVPLLSVPQRIPSEEGNDRLDQILSPPDRAAEKVLTVVVVSPVRDHLSHTEERSEILETRDALGALLHDKLVRHLVAGTIAVSALSPGLANKADREASFSVYKTNNPA